MLHDSFKDFVSALPPSGRLLGIDWGARRIGLAVSDPNRSFAFARPQIARDAIPDFIKSENIVGVVIGLPLYFNGAESETTKKVRLFAAELAGETNVPIVLFDETLTSVEAAENLKGASRGKQNLDSESARIILENVIRY